MKFIVKKIKEGKRNLTKPFTTRPLMTHILDDHYIADANNAHIDTSEFESELDELFGKPIEQGLSYAELYSKIHDLIEAKVSISPNEPSDDQIICRYLSPTKFLWFISEMEIFFGRASNFDDARDSTVPEDYNRCVQHYLMKRNVISSAWVEHVRRVQSLWLVSCWTEITDHHDDHLLWHKYAGGDYGVGITMRYGILRDLFRRESGDDSNTEGLFAGYVSYEQPLKIAPFNKRRIFRNEKEIRFASRSDTLNNKRIRIAELKSEIGLRISPEASLSHREAIRDIWLRLGGEDRIHVAGE